MIGTPHATYKGNIGFRISVTRNKILNVQIILFMFLFSGFFGAPCIYHSKFSYSF